MGPRLARITLRGFRTIRDLPEFVPGDLTVLIGPNGAGKSNFIAFFRMLSWALATPGQLQLHVQMQGGAGRILHDGATRTNEIFADLHIATADGTNRYGFRLVHAAGDTLLFTDEWNQFTPQGKTYANLPSMGAGHREANLLGRAGKTAQFTLSTLRRIIVHQFHNTSATARIRGKWSASDSRWLKEDGANLAPFLLRLQEQHPAHYRRIEDTLRLIAPFFAAFDLYPESDAVLLRWRELGSDQVFDVSQASDGLLRAMALVALLLQPAADLPAVLILDEPELGLHPYAIEVLAGLIRAASKHVQVIVATQSVTLIDQFEPEDIVVVSRPGRESTLRRLDGAALREWLENYTLSELWEKNVMGGRPGT
ncbi:MAG: AAA family ATPase [Acetobacteraceae bacterium]